MIHRFEHHGLLGTVIELWLCGPPARHGRRARRAAGVLLAEIERLQAVFSAFDPDSELCRWRRHALPAPSPEFTDLMDRALVWWERSSGAFNPLVGTMTAHWLEAEAAGRPPDEHTLARLATEIRTPCFSIVDGAPVIEGDCRGLTVNAMAKGYIVDRALAVLADRLDDTGLEVDAIVVNAGGDICHRGSTPSPVGVENPMRPYDNEPPLAVIELGNQAIATSGGSRRGFTVGGRRYNHLLDPRTGRPVEHAGSVTVVADDAATADVVATAAAVMAADEAVAWIESVGVTAALVIDADGTARGTPGWERLPPSGGGSGLVTGSGARVR